MSTDALADVIHATVPHKTEYGGGGAQRAICRCREVATAVRAHYRDAAPISDETIAEALNDACGDTFGWREATPVVRALIVEATATADARIAELTKQVEGCHMALVDEKAHLESAVADAQRHQANYNLAMERAHQAEVTIERVRALANAAEETSTLVDADDIRAALAGDAE